MVFFNCNACGEALKKNQVPTHLNKCRRCEVLSCVDCGKEFWRNTYQEHTQCITEAEKYSGKDFKAQVKKGEVKQTAWVEQCQKAILKNFDDPKISHILKTLQDYPNIPRKKVKFENFLKNSLRIRESYLVSSVWDILAAEAESAKKETELTNVNPINSQTTAPTVSVENGSTDSSTASNLTEVQKGQEGTKLSKREKKSLRQEKMSKQEKKDAKDVKNGEEDEKKTKKKKKRKHEETVAVNVVTKKIKKDIENLDQGEIKLKKNTTQQNNSLDISIEPNRNHELMENFDNETDMHLNRKFNWEEVIKSLLESKSEKEMALKKLKKKGRYTPWIPVNVTMKKTKK